VPRQSDEIKLSRNLQRKTQDNKKLTRQSDEEISGIKNTHTQYVKKQHVVDSSHKTLPKITQIEKSREESSKIYTRRVNKGRKFQNRGNAILKIKLYISTMKIQ